MSGGHERYMHGPGVFVPAHVAAWLDQVAKLRELRTRARGNDSEVDAVLLAIGLVANAYRTGSGARTATVPTREPLAALDVLDTRQAADRLGVGQRAITKAIAARTLPASKVGGRWALTREDVDNYGRRAA